MKILYDHQLFTIQKFGGATRYLFDLISNLPNEFENEIALSFSENLYLTEKYENRYKTLFYPKNFSIKKRIYYYLNQKVSIKALATNDFDLFHPTYYDPYFLNYLKKPFVLTVHDMTHELFKENFSFYDKTIKQKRLLMEKANHIIAISENTKKDILRLTNINETKISVVHHGYKQYPESAPKLFDNYILFVGGRKGYKNFIRFVESVIPLLKDDRTLNVVCTGVPFSKDECDYFKANNIGSQIKHIKASEDILASLYKYARIFVYPSLYEGFGIPILEAFTYGCPVCLSNSSCFPEVAQDAAVYFNPKSTDDIREKIKSLLNSQHQSDELRQKGEKILANFSIEKMVRETVNVYLKVIDHL